MTHSLQAPPLPATQGPFGRAIADLAPWFHNLHMPDGSQTAPNHPLGDFPRSKWRQIEPALPSDLRGAEILDIGCNAGFYSIELARRGGRVYAIDHDERYLRQARWAAAQFDLASRISLHKLGVYSLGSPPPDFPARFDIVLFLGVFYHLRYPLLGLDLAAGLTRDMLIFQTLTTADEGIDEVPADLPISDRARLEQPGWPRMAFIEHSLASDPTNWWAPNAACCEAMIRSTGMTVAARPGHEIFICRWSGAPASDAEPS